VWQWDPSENDRELIHDGLFYSNHNTGSDIDPGQLLPIDVSRHNRRTFRFSLAEVDRSLDENWWARFNWNAARHRTYAGTYLVASSDNPRYASLPLRLYASRTAGDSSEDDDDWAENDDDALLQGFNHQEGSADVSSIIVQLLQDWDATQCDRARGSSAADMPDRLDDKSIYVMEESVERALQGASITYSEGAAGTKRRRLH
jgi:hypothetical protein